MVQEAGTPLSKAVFFYFFSLEYLPACEELRCVNIEGESNVVLKTLKLHEYAQRLVNVKIIVMNACVRYPVFCTVSPPQRERGALRRKHREAARFRLPGNILVPNAFDGDQLQIKHLNWILLTETPFLKYVQETEHLFIKLMAVVLKFVDIIVMWFRLALALGVIVFAPHANVPNQRW
jgi:hypothetical protein